MRTHLGSTLQNAARRAVHYLETIPERRVNVTPAALSGLSNLGGPLPAQGEDTDEILRRLDDFGSPATMDTAGGRFFGLVMGGALPATVAAHWLADAWDQNACLHDASPVSAHLEDVVAEWMLQLLRLPTDSGFAIVTGAQMANFTALAAARRSESAGTSTEMVCSAHRRSR